MEAPLRLAEAPAWTHGGYLMDREDVLIGAFAIALIVTSGILGIAGMVWG